MDRSREELGGPRKRFARRLVVTAVSVAALAAATAPSASAFPSTYCGHGTDYGAWGRVVYRYPTMVGGTHYHVYKHQIRIFVWITVHTRSQVCPYRPHL